MKLSTLVIFFAISLLITSPQNERLSALAATSGTAVDATSVPQKPLTTTKDTATSQPPASTQTQQTTQQNTQTNTQTQQQPTAAPSSTAIQTTAAANPTTSDGNAPTTTEQSPGTPTDANATTPPPITLTRTSTIPRAGGTGPPGPANSGSGTSGSNSSSSQPQIDVPASTTKTIVIAAGVVGGIVVLGGISIVLYRYQKSRASEWDEEGEVVLRDGQGGFSAGNPFQSTLDQYHRSR